MFNVEPPSNIYTEEPSIDITFGVDNPGYVAMTDLPGQEVESVKEADNDEAGNLIIDIPEAKENNNNEDRISDSLSNINIEVMDVDLNYKTQGTTKTFEDSANQILDEATVNILDIKTSEELGEGATMHNENENSQEPDEKNNLETLDETININDNLQIEGTGETTVDTVDTNIDGFGNPIVIDSQHSMECDQPEDEDQLIDI